jgi:hypothetical protein
MAGAGISLVAPLVAIYIVSQLLRNSVGVIAPNLAAELGLSAAAIGLLASIYFIAFAAIQIPLGMALDRFGPRICLTVGAAITAAGAVVFAVAQSQTGLVVGRGLMGLGTAGSLMAPLATYSRRFPPQRFASLAGLQLSLGTTGALLATAPLGFSAATIGWRASFLLVAVITCCVGGAIFLAVKDDRGAGSMDAAGLVFFFGAVSAYSPPLLAHGKALFAPHQVGRGLTVLNVGSMGGAFLTQIVSGAVIAAFPPLPDGSYDLAAYRLVFGLQAAFIVLGLLAYFPARDPR